MGGRGSGGMRVGAGGKPKLPHRASVSAAPTPVSLPMPELAADAKAVWVELAPLAAAEGTLVPATAFEFAGLCRLAVQHALVLAALEVEGLTDRGLKLERSYRGLTQRLEAKLRAFRLAPMGREIAAAKPEKPKSAFQRLEQLTHVVN